MRQLLTTQFQKIAVGLFCSYGHYLLMIDYYYYSTFIVTGMLKNLQTLTVINKCKKTSLQFGFAKELITDNGPNSPAIISNHF